MSEIKLSQTNVVTVLQNRSLRAGFLYEYADNIAAHWVTSESGPLAIIDSGPVSSVLPAGWTEMYARCLQKSQTAAQAIYRT